MNILSFSKSRIFFCYLFLLITFICISIWPIPENVFVVYGRKSLILAAALMVNIVSGSFSKRIGYQYFDILYLVFLIYIAISSWLTDKFYNSLYEINHFIFLYILTRTFIIVFKSITKRYIAKIIVGAILFSILSLVVYHFDFLSRYNGFNNLVFLEYSKFLYRMNSNLVAFILVMMLPLIFYSKKVFSEKMILFYLLLFAHVFFIFATNSRFSIVLTFIFFTFLYRKFLIQNKKLFLSIITVISIGLILLAVFFKNVAFVKDLFFLNSRDQRLEIWGKTLELIKSNPFLGSGPGSWKVLFPSMGMHDFEYSYSSFQVFPHAHNFLIQSLTEWGLIGVFLFSFAVISLFYKNKTNELKITVGKALIVIYILSSMIYGVVYIADFPISYGFAFFGLGLAMTFSSNLDTSYNKITRNIFYGIVILLNLFNLLFEAGTLKAQYNHKQFRNCTLSKSANCSEFLNKIPDQIYVGVDKLVLLKNRLLWKEGRKTDAIINMKQALKKAPYDQEILSQLISWLLHQSQIDDAKYYLKRILSINNTLIAERIKLMRIYLDLNEIEEFDDLYPKTKEMIDFVINNDRLNDVQSNSSFMVQLGKKFKQFYKDLNTLSEQREY